MLVEWSRAMALVHRVLSRHLIRRVLSVRPLMVSLWPAKFGCEYDDLLRAGQQRARQPALMTMVHGGRPACLPGEACGQSRRYP